VSRIGNRTHIGRYTLSSWKDLRGLEPNEARRFLEQQVISTDRLTVVRCVYQDAADFPEHFHPQEQITIVEDGTLEFVIEGQTIRVGKGEMISVEPNVRHATRVGNGGGTATALNLFLVRRMHWGGQPNRATVPTVMRPTH
jgi:quercetin dioxygenase-like cupin family protein